MTQDELQAFVDRKIAEIYEHCDAVQILVSWNDNCSTKQISRGAGNWYARQGMAHSFVQRDNAQEIANEIKAVQPPPDADEQWKEDAK